MIRPCPVERRETQGIGAVALQIAGQCDRLLAARSSEAPFIAPSRMGTAQAIMLEEVSRPFGRAAPFEIARGATHYEAVGRNTPGDQAQVGHRRVTYRQIESVSHHVDHAFGHAEVDRYVGMEIPIFGNHG
jgi:hypothetical protein